MRAVLQRVLHCEITVEGKEISSINRGILALIGIEKEDCEEDAFYIARKIATLRIFEDERGKMNLSVKQISGEVMAVSQFTLLADTSRGNRPGFERAELPGKAAEIFEKVIEYLNSLLVSVEKGIFGAHMKLTFTNDGPVTIFLDSRRRT